MAMETPRTRWPYTKGLRQIGRERTRPDDGRAFAPLCGLAGPQLKSSHSLTPAGSGVPRFRKSFRSRVPKFAEPRDQEPRNQPRNPEPRNPTPEPRNQPRNLGTPEPDPTTSEPRNPTPQPRNPIPQPRNPGTRSRNLGTPEPNPGTQPRNLGTPEPRDQEPPTYCVLLTSSPVSCVPMYLTGRSSVYVRRKRSVRANPAMSRPMSRPM